MQSTVLNQEVGSAEGGNPDKAPHIVPHHELNSPRAKFNSRR